MSNGLLVWKIPFFLVYPFLHVSAIQAWYKKHVSDDGQADWSTARELIFFQAFEEEMARTVMKLDSWH